MKSKNEEELEQRLSALESKYGYLREKVDELDHDETFEKKLASARALLSSIKDRGEGAWDGVKDRAEEAWDEVEEAFQKLTARFKDR